MKAERKSDIVFLAPALATIGDQHVFAPKLQPVRTQQQQAFVDEPVTPRIAVMIGLQPGRIVDIAAKQLNLIDAAAQLAIWQDRGAVAVFYAKRAVGGGCAETARQLGRYGGANQASTAAIGDDAAIAVGKFKR